MYMHINFHLPPLPCPLPGPVCGRPPSPRTAINAQHAKHNKQAKHSMITYIYIYIYRNQLPSYPIPAPTPTSTHTNQHPYQRAPIPPATLAHSTPGGGSVSYPRKWLIMGRS